jgi:hypothetical protein
VAVLDGEVEYVARIVAVVPLVSEPRLQGNVPLHAPLLLTKVRPAPGVSFTTTLAASDGPLFFTAIV